jgi:sialic acid synthase SpsE
VKYLKKHKFKNFSLLKCTSSYPASLKELDLNSIEVMKKRYKCRVGFSDHTDDILASIVAVSKGATIIEKHIKLKDSDKTIDSKFSLSIKNFSKMIKALNKVRLCFGSSKIRINKGEKFANKRKRSIFAIKDITRNEKFTHQNIDCLRPGDGLESKFFEKIINKKSKKFIKAGTPISFSLIS